MALRIETCSEANRAAAHRFYAAYFTPRSDAFLRWRFEGSDAVTTLLALDGDTCGAMVTVVRKPYRVDGQPQEVLEIFDWAALPEYRPRGLGILLLKRLMDDGRPVLVLGGSPDTRALLPRLKWHHLADASVFALPVRGRYLAEKLGQRGRAWAGLAGKLFDAGGRIWFRARGDGMRAVPSVGFDPRVQALYQQATPHRLVACPSPEVLSWMSALPRAGSYLFFRFFDGDSPVGWGLARVMLAEGGARGEIVDVFLPGAGAASYARAITALSRALLGFGVDAILATATCPTVQQALRSCRFIAGAQHPVHLWWPLASSPPGPPCHVMGTTADNPLLPLADPAV